MQAASEIVDWVKRHALWLFLLSVGAWTGAALLRSKRSAVETLGDALTIERAKDQIRFLKTAAEGIAAVDREKANEVLRLTNAIEQHKKTIAELYTGKPWPELSDADVLQALRDAGV